jgi:Protein of unknown function (DUF3043)
VTSFGYPFGVPSLFRRKTEDVVEPAAEEAVADKPARPKSYTPSKYDLGQLTPKRRETVRRTIEKPPSDRKEQARRLREKSRQEREEARAGQRAGDQKYLLPRDRGPERALVRDIVDSRRTIGTWFFGLTFVVMLVGFNRALNPSIYLAANLLFLLFALATAVDSYLITRRVQKLVTERFPKTEQRMRSLYFYAIMRGISFRFIRNPKPKVKPGAKI